MTLDASIDNSSMSGDSNQGDDEVRTLFVSGLPMDTKQREIYLMFRSFKGYQNSLLKITGKEGKKAAPVAFVTFETREQAETSKSELQGVRFDPDLPTTIRIEFAKANTKVSKPVLKQGNIMLPVDFAAAGLFAQDCQWPQPNTNFTDLNGNHITALPQPLHPAITTLPLGTPPFMAAMSPLDRLSTLSMNLPYPLAAPVSLANQAHLIPNPMLAPDSSPPCSTLFVANLGRNTMEEELKMLFSRYPNFRRIKMLRNKGTTPVAFVEYTDVLTAVQARAIHNGHLLPTSENGGMRIEFARHRMGEAGKKPEGVEIIAQ